MVSFSTHDELLLIDSLLAAADPDKFPALWSARADMEVRRCALRDADCQSSPNANSVALAELMANDADFASEARDAVAFDAIRFVKQQLDHFSKIKEERPLTEEEKRFIGSALGHILESLPRMLANEVANEGGK